MRSRTIIHLAQPRITRSYDVQTISEDPGSAELSGPDIESVVLLLRMSNGPPVFDLECEGKLYRSCALASMHSEDSVPFTFKEKIEI